MVTALPLPARLPWPSLEDAYDSFQESDETPVSESREVERATVRCPPRPLWTVPPQTDNRVEWMRAMARGEETIETVRPAAK